MSIKKILESIVASVIAGIILTIILQNTKFGQYMWLQIVGKKGENLKQEEIFGQYHDSNRGKEIIPSLEKNIKILK